ncbi:hypothetical protein NG2371_07163 [Nocardia gamkensis]|nr:hypothetical protein [Nocardia gamkensis]
MYIRPAATAARYASLAATASPPTGLSTTPDSVIRAPANGSAGGSGATTAKLARPSAARLRPCSASRDTHNTGCPADNPYVTNDAHGEPSAAELASVAVFTDAATVLASSAAEGRAGYNTGASGGGTEGPSPGAP